MRNLCAALPPPDETLALVDLAAGETYTRADFRAGVRHWAAALRAQDIPPGAVVWLLGLPPGQTIVAFWGALWAGAVPAILAPLTEKLDPDIYWTRLAALATQSGARAVCTSPEFVPALGARLPLPIFTPEARPSGDVDSKPHPVGPDDLAFLQHSSGTTGLQKGVMLTHGRALAQLEALATALALRPTDRVVSWLPLYHDMGLITACLLPLLRGLPVVLLDPLAWARRPGSLLRVIHAYGGTLCWQPNFAYLHLARRTRAADLDGVSLGHMRLFVNCSEPITPEASAAFLERFAPYGVQAGMLGGSYALAENTFAATQTPPGQPPTLDRETLAPRVAVSSGPPLAGTRIRTRGTPGDILIHSPYLFEGYHRRDDLSRQAFEGEWYLTGDVGYLKDGELYVLGRADDRLTIGGITLFPQDIEAAAGTVPGVHPGRVVAFGVADAGEGTQRLHIVAESDDPSQAEALTRAIRAAVAAQMPVVAQHVTIAPRGWLIKTSSGKLARRANRDKWLAERA